MKVTLIRHGETSWNAIKKLQGHTDIELNETGREQAQRVAEYLKNESFDYIVTSDLKRVSQTADAIIKYHQNIPYHKSDQIREKYLGIFQGMTIEEITMLNDLSTREEYYNYVDTHESVETEKSIAKRVRDYLDMLVMSGYTNFCIVSHSGTIKRMRQYFRGFYDETSPKNCSVSRYEKVNGARKEISFSDDSHLD